MATPHLAPDGAPTLFLTVTTAGLDVPGSGYTGEPNNFRVAFAPVSLIDPSRPMHIAVIRASWDSKNAAAGDLCVMTCGQVEPTRNGLASAQILFSSVVPADGSSETISEVPSGLVFTPRVLGGVHPLTALDIRLLIASNGDDWPTRAVNVGAPTRLTIALWNAR